MPLEIRTGHDRPRGSRRQAWAACGCALLVLMAGGSAPATGSVPRAVVSERAEAPRRFRITVSHSEHGGIRPSHPVPVNAGSELRFTILPRPGYHLDSLWVDGLPVQPTGVLVLRDILAPHKVAATFAANEFVILASAGPHVTIVPSGVVPVSQGRSQSFIFAADSGYKVQELLVDGSPVFARKHYTFASVRKEHRILVRTEHHASTVIAPESGELWLAGESREIRWQPEEKEDADSAEIRISFNGLDGPWEPIWRGLFRTGSALWEVPWLDCDSLVVCVATVDSTGTLGADYSSGLVRVRNMFEDDGARRFFVRATPSPAPVGPVRIEYSLPAPGEATLEIYTVSGRQIWRQPLGFASSGPRSAIWDGRLAGGEPARPGVYFARLTTTRGERNCRLVLVP